MGQKDIHVPPVPDWVNLFEPGAGTNQALVTQALSGNDAARREVLEIYYEQIYRFIFWWNARKSGLNPQMEEHVHDISHSAAVALAEEMASKPGRINMDRYKFRAIVMRKCSDAISAHFKRLARIRSHEVSYDPQWMESADGLFEDGDGGPAEPELPAKNAAGTGAPDAAETAEGQDGRGVPDRKEILLVMDAIFDGWIRGLKDPAGLSGKQREGQAKKILKVAICLFLFDNLTHGRLKPAELASRMGLSAKGKGIIDNLRNKELPGKYEGILQAVEKGELSFDLDAFLSRLGDASKMTGMTDMITLMTDTRGISELFMTRERREILAAHLEKYREVLAGFFVSDSSMLALRDRYIGVR